MSSEQADGGPGSSPMSERMRTLLSRAAEEQLLEQRQVSTVLGELRTLVEDVDERLATAEQVDRLAAEVRAVAARVEGRLDAAEARSAELAERIAEATAMVGRAAQDLVGAVVAGVAERFEEQLRESVATVATATGDVVQTTERRLATHVDDAVLALAEVVLRRRRPVGVPAPVPPGPPQDGGAPEAAIPDEPLDADLRPPEGPDAAGPDAAGPAASAPEHGRTDTHPGEGFVQVPADVEDADLQATPVVPQERRTGDRRGEQRSDGSGRRHHPWWRPA